MNLKKEIETISEQIQKMQKQFSASNIELRTSLEEPILKIQKSIEHINKIYISIPKFESPILEQFESFRELEEIIKEYTEKTPGYFLLIAQHGWFIDLESELDFPLRVAYHLENNKLECANILLSEYYKDNLNQIFEKLIIRHANRKEIFTQIIDGFINGNHSLLIPSVLTQVDGICFDFTKKKFFIKEKKNKYLPQLTSEFENLSDTLLSLYLTPLQNQTPIMVREQDLPKFPCQLNRHEILHGISLNYGTENNSLKVISLLKYISDLLMLLDREILS